MVINGKSCSIPLNILSSVLAKKFKLSADKLKINQISYYYLPDSAKNTKHDLCFLQYPCEP